MECNSFEGGGIHVVVIDSKQNRLIDHFLHPISLRLALFIRRVKLHVSHSV